MEVSKFSMTTIGHYYFCTSPESLLLKKKGHLKCYQFSVSIQPTRSTSFTQPLLARIGIKTPDKNLFKVLSSHNKETPVLEARSNARGTIFLDHMWQLMWSKIMDQDIYMFSYISSHITWCIDEIYDALAALLLPTSVMESNLDSKYIVGLAGPPGAGKSTLASEVARRINMQWPQKASGIDALDPPEFAVVLPMDGFHLYRSQLDEMENPKEAHARRGAPWTFDPMQLLRCLRTLRSQGSVYAPSFDHGVGDPVEDNIFVSLQHKLVIVEGNYLLLEEGVWKEVSSVFDEKWFIEVDIDTAMQRVLKRHISTGKPPDVAKWRIEYNDRPNAELINKSKKNADLVIRSVDF